MVFVVTGNKAELGFLHDLVRAPIPLLRQLISNPVVTRALTQILSVYWRRPAGIEEEYEEQAAGSINRKGKGRENGPGSEEASISYLSTMIDGFSFDDFGSVHQLQHTVQIRSLLLQLLQQIATSFSSAAGGTVSVQVLIMVLYAYGFQSSHPKRVEEAFSTLLQQSDELIEWIIEWGPTSLEMIMAEVVQQRSRLSTDGVYDDDKSQQRSLTKLKMNLAFCRSTRFIGSLYGQSIEVIHGLVSLYEDQSIVFDGLKAENLDLTEKGQLRSGLSTKLQILDTMNSILESAYLIPLGLVDNNNKERTLNSKTQTEDETQAFWEELGVACKTINSTNPEIHPNSPVSLFNQTMMADLERHHGISKKLGSLKADSEGIRDGLVTMFQTQAIDAGKVVDGIALVRSKVEDYLASHKHLKDLYVKATPQKDHDHLANNDERPVEEDDLAVSQVLDVFPDLSPLFIKKCLSHSYFHQASSSLDGVGSGGVTEKIIAAILEDELPSDLKKIRDATPVTQEKDDKVDLTRTAGEGFREALPSMNSRVRFDGERLDVSRLHRGKQSTNTADDVLQFSHQAFLTPEMKASIIALAERPSSDDEEDDAEDDEKKAAMTEAYLDENEDYDDRSSKWLQVKQEIDESEPESTASEEDDDHGDLPTTTSKPNRTTTTSKMSSSQLSPIAIPQAGDPMSSIVRRNLEQALLANPAVFERNSASRKGKERAKLRDETGLADEQIEGWKIMLDRNPKKDKILAKHGDLLNFKGNQSSSSTSNNDEFTTNSAEATSDRPRQTSGARGGRGNERGGTTGGRGGRGRGDGGRKAHDRRQRGNDRKMAKVA